MKQTLQLFLLILCSVLCLGSHAQTCSGEVLNISAPDPNTKGTKQSWQVPSGGIYKVRITARGAAGGSKLVFPSNTGGSGASMSGDFFVASGQVLQAIAGTRGQTANQAGGGGGGSGVQIQSSGLVLVLAGGGGGAGADFSSGAGGGAPITNSGSNGGSASNGGGGGGGLSGNGQNGTSSLAGGGGYDGTGGSAPMNSSDVGFGGGGFGAGGSGGSSGGGGGGGYSGGNAGTSSGSGGSGGGSYNIGTNQSNFPNANSSGGQVIIQCLGTAAFSAIVTPTLPNCGSNQGSINIDLTGDLNGFPNDVVEYAIVSGTSFSGNPTFTSIAAEPFDVTTGTGTTPGTYTVRIRLKYNPDLFTDQTYTIGARGTTVYVNVNATGGANNGSSWADAFVSLQQALVSSCPGSQIWVAAGTYKPHASDRNASFVMVRDVAIYGGFNGTETQLAARNWTTNETILSGDLGATGNEDNSYIVIKNVNNDLTPSNSLLDGFTITGGNNISGSSGNGNGGGMCNINVSPSINNCKFLSNVAHYGGGMYNQNASPSLLNCSFSNNTGYDYGGGMYNINSNPALTNVTFLNNRGSIVAGGGVYNQNSSPTLANCTFSGNYSPKGGGMYNRDNSNPDLRGVSFKGNRAEYGGGMDNESSSSPKLTNCIFSGNYGDNFGGGMRNTNSSPILTNVTFSGNWAVINYGGIANYSSNPVFKNCILWGNSSGVYNDASSTSSYTHCLIQGLNPSGTGNLDGTLTTNNPLFVSQPDFTAAPTTTGDLRLWQCSPAIDAGTATDAPTTDLDGNNRVDANPGGGIVDLGAYEYQSVGTSGGIVYVNASASGSNNGSSWANAYTDLQSALSLARANPSCVSQIWVAAGTYKPTSGIDRGISFSMVNGVAIYGGFPNDGSGTMANRNWTTNPTVLSGDLGSPGVNEDNSRYVIRNDNNGLTSSAILDGFVVTEGNANTGFGPEQIGAGMHNTNASPTISNCIFRGNSAGFNGGAMYNNFSSPVVINCSFYGNAATYNGGAVSNEQATPSFKNCSFTGNVSQSNGGVVASNRAGVTLTNCILWGNSSGISNTNGGSTTVTYSIVEGGYSGVGNKNINPLFVSQPAIGLGTTGNLRLQQCSPAIDAGTSTGAPTTDLDGKNRVDAIAGGGVVDMGAYEYQATYDVCSSCIGSNGIVYVNASASGNNSGRSWANAYTDLQSALNVARTYPSCVSQIWVAAGTYKPTSGIDRGISFSMVNGVAIYGGFPNSGNPVMSDRNWTLNPTILSGDIGDSGHEDDNSFRVIFNDGGGLNNTAILDGVIIQDAYNSGTGNGSEGGGIRNVNASPLFRNCIIRNNFSNQNGGGVYAESSSPSFVNCAFIRNQARYIGGAAFLQIGTYTFTNCIIYENSATEPEPFFGLIEGGGLYSNDSQTSVFVTNSIAWGNFQGNKSSSSSKQISYFNIAPVVSYSIVQGGYTGTGNLSADPLFVNAANGDFRLQQCSPAINAGDPATTSATVGSLDLGGNPRFYNSGRVDMGAYEYQGTFDAVAPIAQVTNSTCTTVGGTPSGGVISAPSGSCPAGSSLYYSTDNGGNWSTTVPTYAQSGPAQTILTRCTCDANPASFGPTSTVTTVPGTCPACPDLTAVAPSVQVTNSVCTTFNGTASGGSISAPSGSCPAGSILQYSTDNGGNWSTTLPTYAQTGPAQTILTRCNCGANSSPTSTVTTVPGTCPACPVLTAAAPAVQVTNSVCTTYGGMASGGVISAPSGSCPAGSTLQYSTDNGGNWSVNLPTYAQTGPAQTILTRCNCGANSSPMSTVTTVPGTCPTCPDLTAAAPAVQVTNSVCTTYGGTASGGSIIAPSGSCPTGSTLQYSTDNGGNWSMTLPTYAQTGPAQTIVTRCNCGANSSPTSTVTTVPGTCPVCPDLTAAAPAVQVTNSVCMTYGGTASGGVISAPSGSCPAGSTLQYSTDNGGNWSTTLPTYAQTGPAQTIVTRCNCGANSSPTSTVTTVPGTCPVCPDLTAAAPAVQVTNSVCTTYGGTASGGVISVPSGSCPVGSTLQYSTDGGNWSTTLPTYAQTGPAQTIITRCNCTADVTKSSPMSTVTTVPGTCPACPDLTAAAPAVQVTNSVCTTFNGTASGGSISAPSGSCPTGSTLQYSTDNGGNWSTTLPTYAQTGPAQTIITRCNCTADVTKSSPTSTVTTVPGTCPACPDLTVAAPAVQVTNSVCTTFNGTASGGSISAPSGSCPAGSTLQYSTDNGGNWSMTLPTYAQTGPAQTIITRCNCTADVTKSSPTSTVTTVPGTCPTCPDLTAAAPAVQVTNSVCMTYGGTASGGSISAPSGSCPVGSTLQYSTDNGGNWSMTLPTYAQTGPAQTIVTRCNCTADATKSSPTSTVTTVPGTCPACPVLTAAAPAVQVTNSVCQAGCTIGGGSISAPSGSCPVGSTLQYQLNVGGWSTTLPTYAQTGPAQTIKTRCVCNSDANQMSPESSVTTIPGTVPALVVPVNGSAVVSCPALAIAPSLPVVNDCNGNPITPSAPVITNNPDPLTCEGTRTYTYSYVCGSATATWSFVYTIEREPFTISTANGSATVYDPALAVAPTPPTVMSACGEVLTPSAPVITNSPNPLLCEGTRTYTYTYTDCEGNTAVWSFVYTVLDNIAPTISCPANVVGCAGQLITFTPPVGMDNCLGAVTTQIAGLPTGSVFPVGITTNTFKVTAANGQTAECSFTVTVISKPTITLTTLQQTLNEGNSQTFCDTDANPVNGLQFNVSGSCVVGNPVWRVQVGSGAWSEWMTNPPVSQLSNNQPHRYQAACDASCAVTYTNPIELTINYRSTVPQNVSLLVDGVSVAVGETKEVCSLVNIPLSFNANCGANEVTIYSVDGGEYSAGLPVGLVDNQYHNYRVRCRQSGGVASCVESESGVMRLKLVVIPSAPTVSLSSTGSCNSGSSFSGQSSCGSLRTVWYNASTNVALPSLPSTVPSQTTSYYARCQTENGCVSEKSNVVTFTLTPTQVAPIITVSQEIVCTGTTVKISANCPAGSQTFWNTGVTTSSFEVSFSNVTKQSYWAKCLFEGGCQSAESVRKEVYWNAFVVTLINIGESKSAVKVNDRSAWSSQFITRDGGPELEQSTQVNPTLYYVENANKMAPRYWTINVEACGLNTEGSLTFDMLATPEMGIIRSFNTHENNAPYFMYANREGWTELYAQNHPAYGFYQDNGAGGNSYDAGLPKGLYKLGIRYWDQKGWGSIYPSTRKPQGNVLAYQEYWFRIQSKDGVGVGAAREGVNGKEQEAKSKGQGANGQGSDNGKQITDNGAFANVMPNPVTNTLRLQIQNSKGQVVQAALSDAAGREVLSRQFVPETNTHQEEFGVSALPTGMYFLKVATAEQQATLKVVKVE
ncbi:hypothetical protein FHS57_002381 [Runella defluvii]|uniref:HYR domain-containing protein n=1 Tax=Runella defluvii TaxID=370973 RepID=A0A7W5ZM44_9BACT|nr:choice-of-anchor Q domain-containing protein [Runella defluvii]MBB3838376.1 hypothetical protein [Runella defluvii]